MRSYPPYCLQKTFLKLKTHPNLNFSVVFLGGESRATWREPLSHLPEKERALCQRVVPTTLSHNAHNKLAEPLAPHLAPYLTGNPLSWNSFQNLLDRNHQRNSPFATKYTHFSVIHLGSNQTSNNKIKDSLD
jgi:hypothetical protein